MISWLTSCVIIGLKLRLPFCTLLGKSKASHARLGESMETADRASGKHEASPNLPEVRNENSRIAPLTLASRILQSHQAKKSATTVHFFGMDFIQRPWPRDGLASEATNHQSQEGPPQSQSPTRPTTHSIQLQNYIRVPHP